MDRGFTLAFAALLLLAGNLSDRFGAKRAFMAGTAGFAVSSLICALAVGASMLVLGRALLGVSAALVLPSSMSVIREAYPRETDRSRALAIWGIGGSSAAAEGSSSAARSRSSTGASSSQSTFPSAWR